MNLFRLTYFETSSIETEQWNATNRCEVYGSREAISSLYFHLMAYASLTKASAPRFMAVFNKDGENQTDSLNKQGSSGLVNINTFV